MALLESAVGDVSGRSSPTMSSARRGQAMVGPQARARAAPRQARQRRRRRAARPRPHGAGEEWRCTARAAAGHLVYEGGALHSEALGEALGGRHDRYARPRASLDSSSDALRSGTPNRRRRRRGAESLDQGAGQQPATCPALGECRRRTGRALPDCVRMVAAGGTASVRAREMTRVGREARIVRRSTLLSGASRT